MKEYVSENQQDFYQASHSDDKKVLIAYLNILTTPSPSKNIVKETEKWINQGFGIAKWYVSALRDELERWGLPEHGLEVDGEGTSLWGPPRRDERKMLLASLRSTHKPAPYKGQVATTQGTQGVSTPANASKPVGASQGVSKATPEPAYTTEDLLNALLEDFTSMAEQIAVDIEIIKALQNGGN